MWWRSKPAFPLPHSTSGFKCQDSASCSHLLTQRWDFFCRREPLVGNYKQKEEVPSSNDGSRSNGGSRHNEGWPISNKEGSSNCLHEESENGKDESWLENLKSLAWQGQMMKSVTPKETSTWAKSMQALPQNLPSMQLPWTIARLH